MRISYQWLTDYVSGGELPSPDEVARLLTGLGLEVETVERPADALEGVLVAEVTACAPHPDADKLTVCEVADGAGSRTVVCGAPNVRAGMKVALAPPGVQLPGGLTIAARAVRGVESAGMLCSGDELGLDDDHSGILDLGDEAEPGTPLAACLGLDDTVFEVGVTPNRPDALSHIGVARDLCALLGLTLERPEAEPSESGAAAADLATIRIEDAARCGRYVGRVVEGVRIGPSPQWMQSRLRLAGVRPINNVVDVTNYVLLEWGHPLHAFDLDRVGGSTIIVRRAAPGEKMTTLDEVERTLVEDDLVIADANEPVALAGVMGGGDSEVREDTTRLLIESAHFEPTGVRRTSRRHGLHTESSHRFERGADPEAPLAAAHRAASLIVELAGGEVRRGAIDVHPAPAERPRVRLRWARTQEILGVGLAGERQKEILEGLGFREVETGADGSTFESPSWRTEMDREIDLIEEVARVHGYEEIGATLPARPAHLGPDGGLDRERQVIDRLREAASAAGLCEVVNYSFVAPAEIEALFAGGGDGPERSAVTLANPLSADQSAMRTTVLVSLLGNARHNRRFQSVDLRLYEIGRAYLADAGGVVHEPGHFCALLSGRRRPPAWTDDDAPVDFYDAKAVVEAAGALLGVEDLGFSEARSEVPWLHPRTAARVILGESPVGWVGELHPLVARAFDLPEGVQVLDLALAPLTAAARLSPVFEGLPRFPAVLRDLAVVVPAAVPARELEAALLRALPEAEAIGARVAEATLFDVYEGAQVGEGLRSLAFAIRYVAPDRTLTDDEAGRLHDALVARLEAEVGARLRA